MNDQALVKIISFPVRHTTIYLIPCQGGYLQVDTAYDRDYPTYRKGLQKFGLGLTDIKYLFLTHHHDDHAGFLNQLTRDTVLTIIASRLSRELLLTGKDDRTHGAGWISPMIRTMIKMMMMLDPKWTLEFPPFTLRDHDILIDGDNRDIMRKFGVAGDILYTPGHCIDHQALLLDGGQLLCGDAASNIFLFAGTHYFPIIMDNMEEAYRSWSKMLDAGARTVYPAHGKPFPANVLRENTGKIKTSTLIPLS